MKITERVAYLKGLCEGMKLDTSDGNGKLISVISEILEDVALELEDQKENALDLAEEIDQISDDLGDVEDALDELCDDECCDDDDDECCCDDDDDEPVFYEVKCPSCGEEITVDEDIIEIGGIECPKCGEKLEFDCEEDEHDDSCGCGCHDHDDK